MSQPNIPNITPIVDLEPIDVINIILASIGLEELALAHLVNAEAEKVQYALGTLETLIPLPTTGLDFNQILSLNRSVNKFLLAASHKELVLLNKLNETIDLFNDVNDQVQTQCACTGSVNVTTPIANITFTQGGATSTSTGTFSITSEICPNCTLTDSTLTMSFDENPVVGNNDSFTFDAVEFNQPACNFNPITNSGSLIVSGEGNLTYNSTTNTANFSLQLTETPGAGSDTVSFVITSPTDPTFSISFTASFADSVIVVDNCNG